ncbi:MAG: hypothetical protein KDB07_09320, partial [Planctomycetes bacterium]|nr:hypothetical protein [Planctomycetota bacterium]
CADLHRKSSRNLLISIGVVSIASAIGIALTFHPDPPTGEESAAFFVAMGVTRFTVIALGVAFITFLGRQYSASNQARLVAEHRHMIAETYMELRKAGLIDASKDALLVAIIGALVKEPSSPLVKGGESGDGGISPANLAALNSITKNSSG